MPQEKRHIRELANKLAKLEQQNKTRSLPQLTYSSIDDGSLNERDADGTLVSVIGKQYDGTHGVVVVAGPKPPAPVAPQATPVQGGIIGRWSGKFMADVLSPMDFSHVSLHCTSDPGLAGTMTPGTLRSTMAGELGDEFLIANLAEEVHYLWLVAWSKAGKPSDSSPVVEATPLPSVTSEQLAAAEAAIAAAQQQLDDATEDLDQRLIDAQTQLTDASGRLDTAETQLTDAFGRLDTVETTAGTAASDAAAAQTAADAAQTAAGEAVTQAAEAAGIAAGKANVLIQSGTPSVELQKATNLWIDTTGGANTPKRWNGSTWVAVTDKAATDAASAAAAASSAASAAQTKANEAHTLAGTAESNAQTAITAAGAAQTSADNLPKVLHGTGGASGTAPNGSIWFQHLTNLQGPIIGQWARVSGAWVSTPIRTEAIANLDVGKLTSGTATITQLVAEKIAAATGQFIELDVSQLNAAGAAIDTAVVNKLFSDVVVAKTATASAFIGENAILSNSVTATHIVASAELTGKVVRGDMFQGLEFIGGTFRGATFETHEAADEGAKFDPLGFRVYGPKLEGAPVGDPIVWITANGLENLGVADSEGNTLASIGPDGYVTAQGLNVNSDPEFNGMPLLGGTSTDSFQSDVGDEASGLLDYFPRGVVARGYRAMSARASANNAEREILELSYTHYPYRAYRIHISPVAGYLSDSAYGYMKIYSTTDGSKPTMNDANLLQVKTIRAGEFPTNNGMYDFGTTWYDFSAYDLPTHTRRYLFTHEALNGEFSWFGNARDGSQFRVWVEDMGPIVVETGLDRNGIRANGGSAPAPPTESEPQNYTKTYQATGWRSYRPNGNTYAYSTSNMFQGTSPAGYGNLRSNAVFDSWTGDLSGATITSVEAYFYFRSWYYNAGGTARIQVHADTGGVNSTIAPQTFCKSVSGWRAGEGKWVKLPSSFWNGFKDGTWRGVGLAGSGYGEYGYANGASTRIRIKYKK